MYRLMIFRQPFNNHLFICIANLLYPRDRWVERTMLQFQITVAHMAVSHVNVRTRITFLTTKQWKFNLLITGCIHLHDFFC